VLLSQAAAALLIPILLPRTLPLFRRAGTSAGLGQDSCSSVNTGYLNTAAIRQKMQILLFTKIKKKTKQLDRKK